MRHIHDNLSEISSDDDESGLSFFVSQLPLSLTKFDKMI